MDTKVVERKRDPERLGAMVRCLSTLVAELAEEGDKLAAEVAELRERCMELEARERARAPVVDAAVEYVLAAGGDEAKERALVGAVTALVT